LLFLGAGSSSSFNVPTMGTFVDDTHYKRLILLGQKPEASSKRNIHAYKHKI
jgi:hypothetical protein